MTSPSLSFEQTRARHATHPVERGGGTRDQVRLMVSTGSAHTHHAFRELPDLLLPGDLLVVNRSATLPASLPAMLDGRPFRLNLSTKYGDRLWLAEPRWSSSQPGPLPIGPGTRFDAAGVRARMIAAHPGMERLIFVRFAEPIEPAMERRGEPIRYGYVDAAQPLEAYSTLFGDRPGSAEMPSAARPFTERTVAACRRRGIAIAPITLHTGVSSLEVPAGSVESIDLFAEPFEVPAATVDAIARTRASGGRVVAVGTTVVRALESARRDGRIAPARGFTRQVVRPGNFHGTVDALLTGFHESETSHLAMLFAVGGSDEIRDAYRAAIEHGYLWHEFGDVHLIWSGGSVDSPRPADRPHEVGGQTLAPPT